MRSFRLIVTAALAIGVAAGSAFAAVTASASVATPTEITGFAVSPTVISYGSTQVTVSGQLVEDADPSVGIAGQQVAVEYAPPAGSDTTIATVVTDSAGNFTASVPLPAGGGVRAVSNGGTTYGEAASKTVSISTSPEYPVVTLNPQARTVAAGTSLTFTGKAQVTVNGTVEPLAGAPVELLENGTVIKSGATTGTDGTFSLAVKATSGGVWQAEVDPVYAGNQSLYNESASNGVTVAVASSTRIESFSVPATREAHSAFTVSGTAQRWNGTSWTAAAYVTVTVYRRVEPSTTWKLAGSTQASSSGAFKVNASVTPGHTVWQVRVPAQGSPDVYHASSSGTHNSFITDKTCFTSLAANHFDGRTLVSGFVIDHCGTSRTFGIVKGSARVYYHPRGSTAWRYLGSARTGAGGSVNYTYYHVLNGYFRIVFPAQGYYLSSTSKTVYLS